MSEITHNIPHIETVVDASYLTNGEKDHLVFCIIHSFTTIPGHALLCNILLPDGSMYYRLPLWAFGGSGDLRSSRFYQHWNVPSYMASVAAIELIKNCRIEYSFNGLHPGRYLFTVDYAGSAEAESFGDFGHKVMHICLLDDGSIIASPNSNICFMLDCLGGEPWTRSSDPPAWRTQRDWKGWVIDESE